ncbi:67-DIMETHYL-8-RIBITYLLUMAZINE SYNTHASE [Salix viminalis]|uniref:67-DIMETHYL-8-RIBITYLLUMAZINE SYNTHASE n=1 Tax=Salix viminalis TaxID=40686 RepID=A0A6N2KKQ2_SALVM|nr:67-DIMETHYL-8-RIBITYLLUMAZINE SYNTHASE [Salix viminalis]
MLLSLVQTIYASPFQSKTQTHFNSIINSTTLLPRSLFPTFDCPSKTLKRLFFYGNTRTRKLTTSASFTVHASLIEAPVLWVGRLCIFYALLKAGLAGSEANPLVSGLGGGGGLGAESGDLGFSNWIEAIQGKPDKEAADKRKLVSKWHPTTKGTLRRNYRVPSKSEGRRRLKAIAALLSEDDYFLDATSHKGCQIRRESAHGESVCCNNVRALFDELPTPHLLVEITAFPAGPLTEKDYVKAEKLERVLRSGPSI